LSKIKETAKVISQEELASGVYSMWISTNEVVKDAKQGQFISIYCNDGAKLLPRPISICEISTNALRIVYRVVGGGTKEFSKYSAGDDIEIFGPLGNGFSINNGNSLLIAGGIGIPPMVELAKSIREAGNTDINIVIGYRDKETFLLNELQALGNVYIATEDGSVGTKGNVMDAIRENDLTADSIYSCGPTPMLKAVQEYGIRLGIKTQLSLEEKMACGIGACLACVCKSKEKDAHTNVNNKRICKDGPVFLAEEVLL